MQRSTSPGRSPAALTMRDWSWLSSTWEPNWRSFQYFNLYRLILACLLLLVLPFPNEWTSRLHLLPSTSLYSLLFVYLLLLAGGWLASRFWPQHFNAQLSLQVLSDVVAISALIYLAGGVSSGLGLILLVSLAAASLVGQGRLVLFYAALASLGALLVQCLCIVLQDADFGTVMHAGFLSAGYFATAVLARLLGQRVMANEDLARRRGIALENQIRISRRIVERMQDGVLIVTRDGEILRHNPMGAQLLSLPAEGGRLRDCAPTLAAALDLWLQGASDDSLALAGASHGELNARFEPTASSDGEVLIFIEDMGRIKERAKQMKLAALGRLTASIAHEIRNPLSAISHAGELLREEPLGAVHDRLLRIIGDNTVRLDRIVKDVLELGRQRMAQVEHVDLQEFCVSFIESLAASEHLPEGVIRAEIAPGSHICFDPAQLYQVLWNIGSNALRHASRQPGAVRFQVTPGKRAGSVELHVFDDGPGVPAAVAEQIFEPFFTTHHQGTGLGLFIARELCGANGAALLLAPGDDGGHFIVSGRSDRCLLSEVKDVLAAS